MDCVTAEHFITMLCYLITALALALSLALVVDSIIGKLKSSKRINRKRVLSAHRRGYE